jgi:hypothetical protein
MPPFEAPGGLNCGTPRAYIAAYNDGNDHPPVWFTIS